MGKELSPEVEAQYWVYVKRGMVDSHVCRLLRELGYGREEFKPIAVRTNVNTDNY
jgi:hypothetical protein